MPDVWEFIVLALASARLWKLVGDDRILDRPRDWLLDRISDDDRAVYWGDFLVCPWCAGFWVSGAVLGVFLATVGEWPQGGNEVVAALGVWLAISCIVGLFGMAVEALQHKPE